MTTRRCAFTDTVGQERDGGFEESQEVQLEGDQPCPFWVRAREAGMLAY